MMDKNDIRTMSIPKRDTIMDQPDNFSIRKVSIDKLLQTDMTFTQMSELTGMSVYEIRRYIGLIQ